MDFKLESKALEVNYTYLVFKLQTVTDTTCADRN